MNRIEQVRTDIETRTLSRSNNCREFCLSITQDVPLIINELLNTPFDKWASEFGVRKTPAGFITFNLASIPDSGRASPRVRLHLWPEKESEDVHIHNHGWPFASATIAGNIDHRMFQLAEGATHHHYKVARGKDGYDYAEEPKTGVSFERSVNVPKDGMMKMEHDELHTVRTAADTTTLLVQGVRQMSRSDVVFHEPIVQNAVNHEIAGASSDESIKARLEEVRDSILA